MARFTSSSGLVVANAQDRAEYDGIVAMMDQYGLKDALPLNGYLRSERVLGVQNSFTFPIRSDEAIDGQSVSPTERRLRTNDAFFISHISVLFRTYAVQDPVDPLDRITAKLHSFGNLAVFGLNTPSIDGAFNGRLSVKVDETTYIDALDMDAFLYAQQGQEGLAVSTVAGTGVMSQDAVLQDAAYKRLCPLLRFNGSSNNEVTVTLPTTMDFTLVDAVAVDAVLKCRGWLVQNGGMFRTVRGA